MKQWHPPTPAERATELLDGVLQVYEKLSVPLNESDLGHQLSILAERGRACLQDGTITPAFHTRYARVLLVVRMVLITDTGKILAPIVDKELIAFVRDVTGKTYDPNGPVSQQIGDFSDAVATELTRLRLLASRLR